MANPRLTQLFERLRDSGFAQLAGTRVFAVVPIPEAVLNELLAAVIPPSAPVREVTVRPRAGDVLSVRVKGRADFLPPLTLTLAIERQPELPDGPLVLRIESLPGLFSLAGAAFPLHAMLPPGVRLENQRLYVDVRTVLERHGQGALVRVLERAKIKTDEGRLLLDVVLGLKAE